MTVAGVVVVVVVAALPAAGFVATLASDWD